MALNADEEETALRLWRCHAYCSEAYANFFGKVGDHQMGKVKRRHGYFFDREDGLSESQAIRRRILEEYSMRNSSSRGNNRRLAYYKREQRAII